MSTTRQIQDFIRNTRIQANALLDAVEELGALRAELDATAMGAQIQPEHFSPDDAGLTPEDIVAVYTTHDAIKALLATGHSTNLYKVK